MTKAGGMKKIDPMPAPKPPARSSHAAATRNEALFGAARRLSIFLAAVIFGGVFCYGVNDGETRLGNYIYAQISYPAQSLAYKAPKKIEPAVDLNVKAALSLDFDDNGEKTIFEKNADEILPIASLTKLMTATVALENPIFYQMNETVAISQTAAGQIDVPIYGNFQTGQVCTVRQLLNWMLFYSSNDAACALAEIIGTDEFVAAMNQKAQELGLKNTNFYNSSGLDEEGKPANSSSVRDLAFLAEYIYKFHPEIFSFSTQPGPYLNENGILSLNFWDGQTLVGGKTGFTEKAGGCMLAVFKDQTGRRYLNIVLGAVSPEDRVAQMQKLINLAANSNK